MTYKKLYKIFANIPTLKTKRFILRKITEKDASDVYEYSSDEQVSRYLFWYPHTSIEYTKEYLYNLKNDYRIGKYFDWGIEWRTGEYTGKMIGTCGFTSFDLFNNSAEVGYVLNKEFWGQGIACEALDEVIRFGFEELLLHRIEAKFAYENKNSLKVMEKCNMQFEGVLRSSVMLKGSYTDIGICSILGEEYLTYKLIQEFSK